MPASFAAFRAAEKPNPLWFAPPEPAGRRLICGFSYIQRIGKGAATDVWFPASLHENVAARVLAGDETVLDEFHVEWAAVRQFELLQESDNYYIYDLKVENFARAFEDVMKMRARGYRITVITMGHYVEPADYDELRLLDVRLQDEITQLVHMLYLESQSLLETSIYAGKLEAGQWDVAQALPHVAMTLGAQNLFDWEQEEKRKQGKAKGKKGRTEGGTVFRTKLSRRFFQILEVLSQQHIKHDVAVGLALPEAAKRKNWVYCAAGDVQFNAFQTALANVFRPFDQLSLGALHERTHTASEIMPVMHHMRGYGDRNPSQEDQNRAAAQFLRQAGYLRLN